MEQTNKHNKQQLFTAATALILFLFTVCYSDTVKTYWIQSSCFRVPIPSNYELKAMNCVYKSDDNKSWITVYPLGIAANTDNVLKEKLRNAISAEVIHQLLNKTVITKKEKISNSIVKITGFDYSLKPKHKFIAYIIVKKNNGLLIIFSSFNFNSQLFSLSEEIVRNIQIVK